MAKEDTEDCQNSTKCWICDHAYIDGGIKVNHITVTSL